MAETVLTNSKIYFGSYDLTGHSNSVALETGADLGDATTFGSSGWRERASGLKTASGRVGGYWDAATNLDPDDHIWSEIGAAREVLTICPTGGAAAAEAFSMRSVAGTYSFGGSVGDVAPFELDFEASGEMFRGTVIATQTVNSTGGLTAYELGAVAEGQSIYFVIHVTALTGTITLKLESDSNENFLVSPEYQVEPDQFAAVGASWGSAAGEITDTWYRVNVTQVSDSATIVAVAGIL